MVGRDGWFLIGGAAIALLGFYALSTISGLSGRAVGEGRGDLSELEDRRRRQQAGRCRYAAREAARRLPVEPVTQQGGLLVAKFVLASAPDRAADELRFVMEHSKDPELGWSRRLRLARVLAYARSTTTRSRCSRSPTRANSPAAQ